MNVAFVLVSYRRDAPAGMERSVAGLCAGLRALGHRATVLSADLAAVDEPGVIPLRTLGVDFPCDDGALRAAAVGNRALAAEIAAALADESADVVCYVDALWGLGRAAVGGPVRRVLMVHVVGHDEDMRAALDCRPEAVLAPSQTVVQDAAARGYVSSAWKVVPNALLVAEPPVPDPSTRRALRRGGPVRVLARLGSEKGVLDLLLCAPAGSRPIEVAMASAGFERDPGSQQRLLARCESSAAVRPRLRLRPALPWLGVPEYCAGAALVIVPSTAETFGLVALEAMSVGTPVVARTVGNLPNLIGPAGALVAGEAGADQLWRAAGALLDDAARYERASLAARERAAGYHPVTVAARWIEAVMP